jgi:hypothetical protein
MNAKEVNAAFDLVGFVSGLGVTLHRSGAYWTSVNGCPICRDGKDRFQIKRTVTGDIWHCRKCTNDKYHSVIDFAMGFYNVDFRTALQKLGGDALPTTPRSSPRTAPDPVKIEFPAEDWQTEAWREVRAASDALLGIPPDVDVITYAVQLAKHNDSVIGREARAYLTARGLNRAAWVHFGLGYCVVFGRPAISIPYTDGQQITAIKYRFLDPIAAQDKSKRFAMKAGSKPHIFGMQTYTPACKNLVIVEGEINAISIWQIIPQGVTVVSCGGDTNSTPLLRAIASRFDKILIWMDEGERAESIRRYLGRPDARTIKTPRNVQGIDKWDANEMLQAGYLAEFIGSQLQERVTA